MRYSNSVAGGAEGNAYANACRQCCWISILNPKPRRPTTIGRCQQCRTYSNHDQALPFSAAISIVLPPPTTVITTVSTSLAVSAIAVPPSHLTV